MGRGRPQPLVTGPYRVLTSERSGCWSWLRSLSIRGVCGVRSSRPAIVLDQAGGGFLLAGEEGTELADRAHQRSREDDGGVLVDADLDHGLKVAQLQRQGVRHHRVGGLTECCRGEGLAFGVDGLGALLALRLGLACHRALHAVGQLDVLELDEGDHDAPVDGVDVEDLANVQVDAVGLREGLVQRVLTNHFAQRGLGDLVDRGVDVLNRYHRLHRVDNLEVGHRRHIDADVVTSDDALGLDRHGDDPQRDPVQHVDERDDDPQARSAHADDATESEQDPDLVLLDDLEGAGGDGEDDKRNNHNGKRAHDETPGGAVETSSDGWGRDWGQARSRSVSRVAFRAAARSCDSEVIAGFSVSVTSASGLMASTTVTSPGLRLTTLHGSSSPIDGSTWRAWWANRGLHAPRIRCGSISTPIFWASVFCMSISATMPKPLAASASLTWGTTSSNGRTTSMLNA